MRNTIRKPRATRATMLRLLGQARYEVLPTASVEDKVREHVPLGRTLTVTASPSKGLEATFSLAERLAAAGY
jgi:methylenetetrahydrofolate reductase (NADPH)